MIPIPKDSNPIPSSFSSIPASPHRNSPLRNSPRLRDDLHQNLPRSKSPALKKAVALLIQDHLNEVPSSELHAIQGSSITSDIYKFYNKTIQSDSLKKSNSHSDLVSFSLQNQINSSDESDTVTARMLREPGGFRRHFIEQRNEEVGLPKPRFLAHNFLDFLALYGYYGGDLRFDDEDLEDEVPHDSETAVLLPPQSPTIVAGLTPRGTRPSISVTGTSPQKAFFMLLKSFVGTGVLFLPKAFMYGGIVFSTILIIFFGWLNLHCMLLLLETNKIVGGSFGDIGEKLYGSGVRYLVLVSIAVSQAGFSCAYYIFISQSLRDLVMLISNCKLIYDPYVFILAQVVVYAPLSLVRRIKFFSITSLVADVFILIGLGYILYNDFVVFGREGFKNVILVNFEKFPIFIGTSLFAFEGICLILPISERLLFLMFSMKEPEKFPRVLTLCVFVIGLLFILTGSLSYLAFGEKVETLVFLNLPSTNLVLTIQFLYILAILLSFPLCVYPAIRITESAIFGVANGKTSVYVKWQKNCMRVSFVAFLSIVAISGSKNLDKFVSLVGCLACIPLSFIYPAVFHYHVAKSTYQKRMDIAVAVFGFIAMVYTTYVTIYQWVHGDGDVPLDRCQSVIV